MIYYTLHVCVYIVTMDSVPVVVRAAYTRLVDYPLKRVSLCVEWLNKGVVFELHTVRVIIKIV